MDKSFKKSVIKIALPVTLQSLLQSSFSVVDQMMIGQLGENSIAGIGLGGKFASIYTVVLAAVSSVAGILISQYMGKKEEESVSRSFFTSMVLSLALAAVFFVMCVAFPEMIMGLYTKDEATKILAVKYIRILAVSFLPMAVSSMMTTMLRCMEIAVLPMCASIFALVLNTGLNYLLILGKWGLPRMGVEGAAAASVAAQIVSFGIILVLFFAVFQKEKHLFIRFSQSPDYNRQYIRILCPMLICEFLWSLGENVYTAVYGNIGTDACAAMTMTVPVQTIVIGALSGLSQASAILIGKSLGAGNFDQAYKESKKLMGYGLLGSVFLSLLLAAFSPFYVRFYQVEPAVQELTRNLLLVIAVIAPVKVMNMILGGGILRSGGKTEYTMWIDIIGTWVFGVPLGLLSAFVWKLPVTQVYFILSMEECVRLGISFVLFKKRAWMKRL